MGVDESSTPPKKTGTVENPVPSRIAPKAGSTANGSSTTPLNTNQGKPNSQGTTISQQAPLYSKPVQKSHVTPQTYSSLTPNTPLHQNEGQGGVPKEAANNIVRTNVQTGFGITSHAQNIPATLPVPLTSADVHAWQNSQNRYPTVQHPQFFSASPGTAANSTNDKTHIQQRISSDSLPQAGPPPGTSPWKGTNVFPPVPYAQSSPSMAMKMSPVPAQRHSHQQQFLHTTPQTPPERLWETPRRPSQSNSSQNQVHKTINSPPPPLFESDAVNSKLTQNIPTKVTDAPGSQQSRQAGPACREIQVHPPKQTVHTAASPNAERVLLPQGALDINSLIVQHSAGASTSSGQTQLNKGAANISHESSQVSQSHLLVTPAKKSVNRVDLTIQANSTEQTNQKPADGLSKASSAIVDGDRTKPKGSRENAEQFKDAKKKKLSGGQGQFDDAEEDAALHRVISSQNPMEVKVGQHPTVNITGAIPLPGFDVSKAQNHPTFPFVPWHVPGMQYMMSQGQLVAGNTQNSNKASQIQDVQGRALKKEPNVAKANAESCIGGSVDSEDPQMPSLPSSSQVQTQETVTPKKRKKIGEDNRDKPLQKKKRQKKLQNREPPTEIGFSMKDWEFAYTTLSGFDDLASIISDQDCHFLGQNFWIFSIQQLDWVLCGEIAEGKSGESKPASNLNQQTTRWSILEKLLTVKDRHKKLEQSAKTNKITKRKPGKQSKQTDPEKKTPTEENRAVVVAKPNKGSPCSYEANESKSDSSMVPKETKYKETKALLDTDNTNKSGVASLSTCKDEFSISPRKGLGHTIAAATEIESQSLENASNMRSSTEKIVLGSSKKDSALIIDAIVEKKYEDKGRKEENMQGLDDRQDVRSLQTVSKSKLDKNNNVTVKIMSEKESTNEKKRQTAAATDALLVSKSSALNELQEGKVSKNEGKAIQNLTNSDSSMDAFTWAQKKMQSWESEILQWREEKEKTKAKIDKTWDKKEERTDFSLSGPLACLVPIGSRNFLASLSITHAFKFLSTKKTEASPLLWTLGKWRQKCGFTLMKSAALSRYMIGLAVRVEKAITLLPPADEYTRTWMGGPLSVLTGGAKDFLIDECRLQYGEDLLGARTKDLADRLVAWRAAKKLLPLKGSGKVAMVSGWKASIKEAREASSGVGKVLKESDIFCDNSVITEGLEAQGDLPRTPITDADTRERCYDSPTFISDYLKEKNMKFLRSQGITTARQLLEANKSRSSDLIKEFVKYRHAEKFGSTELSSCAKVMNDWSHKLESFLKNEGGGHKRQREDTMNDTQKCNAEKNDLLAKEKETVNLKATENVKGLPTDSVNPNPVLPLEVQSSDAIKTEGAQLKKPSSRKIIFKCSEDAIESLSKTTRLFLEAQGITSGEHFLNTKTSILAAKFIEWRALQNMNVLKGYGSIASVSAWKGTVRKAAADNGWGHILEKTPKPKRGQQPSVEKKSEEEPRKKAKKDPQTKAKKELRMKRNASPKASEMSTPKRKPRPAKIKPLCHPEVLFGQHARLFSVSNRNGDLYDFKISVRKPNPGFRSTISFPPSVGVYLQYVGSRSCDLTSGEVTSPEAELLPDREVIPVLTDAKSLEVDECDISDFDGTSCDSFSSRRKGFGLIDLVPYGMFPSVGNDRFNTLKADIENFVGAPSGKKIVPASKGEASTNDTLSVQELANDPQSRSAQTIQSENQVKAALPEQYAANVFAQKDDQGIFHSYLYLDQPMEKGQTVQLIADRAIREPSRSKPQRHETDLRMHLRERISLLSKEDLMSITDNLSRTIGESLLNGVSQVVNPPHDNTDSDIESLERLFIARRRLHWVADQIKQQYNRLEDMQQDGRAPPKKARRRNLIALYWKSELCHDLSAIPGGKGPDVNKLLRKEVGKEVLLSMSSSGILKNPFRVDLWCGMSSGLLRKCVKRISTYLLKDLPATEESQKVLIKALKTLIASATKSVIFSKQDFKDLAFPAKESDETLAGVDAYRDAMNLCNEQAFISTIAGRPVLLDHFLVATTKNEDSEAENLLTEMASVVDVIKGDKMFDCQWYIENQIVPIVDAIVQAGMVEWIVPKGAIDSSSYPRPELLDAVSGTFESFDKKIHYQSRDYSDEFSSNPEAAERVKVEGLSIMNPPKPVPFATNSYQLFLGLVWPLLHDVYGWKIDAGEDPSDVVFLMPGGKNRSSLYSQIGKVQKERRRKRAKRLAQMKEVSLDNLTKSLKGTFVALLERGLNKEECMDETSSNYESSLSSSSQRIALASKVLEDFLKTFLKSLPMNDSSTALGRDRLQDMVDAILGCFNSLAPRLLYPLEAPSESAETKLETLGCDILLRFLLLLPRLLKESGLLSTQLEDVMAISKELTHYISSHLQLYFDEGAHPPEEEYMDKIVGPNPYILTKVKHVISVVDQAAKSSKEREDQNDSNESSSSNTDANQDIVRQEDKPYVTDFTGLVMAQVVPYRATNADVARRGRKIVKLGTAGLACRHCWGEGGEGKYFFSTLDSLGTSATVVHNHMVKCPKFPSEMRTQLIQLKAKHVEQRKLLPFGAQASFFGRVWSRIHNTTKTSVNNSMPSFPLRNTKLETQIDRRDTSAEKNTCNDNKNNDDDNELNSKDKGFKCHVKLLEYLGSSSEWCVQEDLMEAVQEYYKWLEYGGNIYNTEDMPSHFNSEYLLAQAAKQNEEKRQSSSTPSKRKFLGR